MAVSSYVHTQSIHSEYIIFAHSYHVLNKYEKNVYVFWRLKLPPPSVAQFFCTEFRDRPMVFRSTFEFVTMILVLEFIPRSSFSIFLKQWNRKKILSQRKSVTEKVISRSLPETWNVNNVEVLPLFMSESSIFLKLSGEKCSLI